MIVAGQPILASDFKDTSSGVADAGLSVKLNASGQLAKGFIQTAYPTSYDKGGFNLHYGNNGNFYVDTPDTLAFQTNNTSFGINDYLNGYNETRDGTSDWAAADNFVSGAIIGAYVYVLYQDTAGPYAFRVYRYAKNNLAAGGTLMTVSGTALGTQSVNPSMSTDGSSLYFNYNGMTDATNTHIIAKYTVSGTTMTYSTSITCGSTATNLARFHIRASDGHILGCSSADGKVRRYNTSGTLQATTGTSSHQYQYFESIGGVAFYVSTSNTGATQLFNFTRIAIV